MSLDDLFAHPAAIALGWALLHFVWQGAAVAGVLGLTRVAMRRARPALRYAAACAALATMLVLPVATFLVVRSDEAAVPRAVATGPARADAAVAARTTAARPGFEPWVAERFEAAIPWLLAAWLAGVAMLSARFAAALAVTRRLRRATRDAAPQWRQACQELSARLGVRRTVRVCESALAEVPTVIGWLRPVILVPAGVFTGLDPRQVEAILAHELAHVRRHDYLVNLVQTAIETLLFYHPAVWWVSRQVREEREHCCDDLAVAACGDVLTYATALAELEELRAASPALALAATGGSLVRRIERLLGRTPARHVGPAGLACALALALGFGALANVNGAEIPTAVAVARGLGLATAPQAPDAPPAPPVPAPAPAPAPAPLAPFAPLAPLAPLATNDVELTVGPIVVVDPMPVVVVEPMVGYAGEPLPPQGADEYSALGYDKMTDEERRAFEIHEVSPDFIREMQAAGYAKLSAATLLAMRIHDVDASFVREMQAIGFANLPAEALLAMRIHDVSADYVNELRGLGVADAGWETFVAGRVHDVSASFVRKMAEAGISNLPFEMLVAMRIHDVSPRFAREIQATGYAPSAEELVAMRIHDVDAAFIHDVVSRRGKVSLDEIVQERIEGEHHKHPR